MSILANQGVISYNSRSSRFIISYLVFEVYEQSEVVGCRQVVRHWFLEPAFVGSNPTIPAN